MTNLSTALTALRQDGYFATGWLAAFTGSIVLNATVSSTPTYPATSLAITVNSGSASNVKPGFLVRVETSTGSFKGTTRIRFSGVVSSTSLPIRELARDDIDIAATDVVKVYSIVPLSDKLTDQTADFKPDGLAYSDQGENPPPVACSGGHYAAHVDDGETFATVTFKGDASYTVDPDSAGTVAHLWTLPTGCAFASGSADTDANPTVEVDAGQYTIQHRVTDSSNSKAITQYVQVAVFDDTTEPLDIIIDSLQGDLENGWSATVQAFGDTTLASLPDGTLVALFVQEWNADAYQSFGSVFAGRSSIKLLGYLSRDSNRGSHDDDELRFEIVSPMMRMSSIPGYTKALERNASPDNWAKIKGLTAKRAMLQLFQFYTTIVEAGFDVVFDVTDYDYPLFYLQKTTPREQIRELADALDARLVCMRNGRFEIHTDPALIAEGSRSGITTNTLAKLTDIYSYEFSRAHFAEIELVEVRGFTSGTTPTSVSPLFSRYPGDAPGLGSQFPIVERKIAANQSNLNERAGRIGAKLNDVYQTAGGVAHRGFELTLTLPGQYDVFDWYKVYTQVDLDDDDNLRGVDLSALRYYVVGVSVDYSDKAPQVTLRLKVATNGFAGTTYVPPQADFPVYIDPGQYDPPLVPSLNPGGGVIPGGTGRIGIVTTDGLVILTTNFNTTSVQGSPTWATAGNLSSSTVQSAAQKVGTASTLFVVDNTKIYKVTGVGTSVSVATAHTFASSPSGVLRVIDTERADANWVMCISYDDSYGTKCAYSTDGGDTYTEVTITANNDGGTGQHQPTLRMSPFIAGTAYAVAFDGSGNPKWYKTTNYGATWATSTDFQEDITERLGVFIYRPYANQSYILYTKATNAPPYLYDLKRATSGANVDISPTYSGNTYGAASSSGTRSIACHDGDANKAIMIGRFSNTSTLVGMWRTRTLLSMGTGAGWELVLTPDSANAAPVGGVEIGGNGEDTYVYGTEYVGFAQFSTMGENEVGIDDRSGNIPSLTSGRAVRLFGY